MKCGHEMKYSDKIQGVVLLWVKAKADNVWVERKMKPAQSDVVSMCYMRNIKCVDRTKIRSRFT